MNGAATPYSIAIFGAGGHGRVLADCALALGYTEIVMFDDKTGPDFNQMLGKVHQFDGCAVALGRNDLRLDKLDALAMAGAHLHPLIHPSAVISPSATISEGSFVAAGAIVGPLAKIGRGAILNTGCSVDHDCVLQEGVHVAPGARLAGGVHLGDRVWIGIGAVVREGLHVGAGAILGAGAAVVADVAPNLTMLGVPARAMHSAEVSLNAEH